MRVESESRILFTFDYSRIEILSITSAHDNTMNICILYIYIYIYGASYPKIVQMRYGSVCVLCKRLDNHAPIDSLICVRLSIKIWRMVCKILQVTYRGPYPVCMILENHAPYIRENF